MAYQEHGESTYDHLPKLLILQWRRYKHEINQSHFKCYNYVVNFDSFRMSFRKEFSSFSYYYEFELMLSKRYAFITNTDTIFRNKWRVYLLVFCISYYKVCKNTTLLFQNDVDWIKMLLVYDIGMLIFYKINTKIKARHFVLVSLLLTVDS